MSRSSRFQIGKLLFWSNIDQMETAAAAAGEKKKKKNNNNNNKIWSWIQDARSAIFMIIIQVVFAGVNVLYKLAANDGMNPRIIVAYRFSFAAVFMLPLALLLDRERPNLTWIVLLQAFFSGLFGGSLAQNLYVESLTLTSATFASATANLVPGVTLILATCFRLEKVGLGRIEGKAKVLGTLLGIGGAMVLTFYKGIQFKLSSASSSSSSHTKLVQPAIVHPDHDHHLLGALLGLGSCFSYAVWLIMQAKMMENYPYHYSCTALMCTMAALQALLFALCVDRDSNHWKLGWDIRLLAVSYSGIVASGLIVTLMTWCVRMRGPLYASVFNPLMLVLVALAGCLFLNEILYLGSVIGAVLIVLGLYVVLWSKGREMKKATQLQVPDQTNPSKCQHAPDHDHQIIIIDPENI